MKIAWKTIQDVLNVKSKNDMPINSLLSDETTTTNAKIIANHFNTSFTSVSAGLNEKTVKAKKTFSHHLGQIPVKLPFFPNNSSRQRIFE